MCWKKSGLSRFILGDYSFFIEGADYMTYSGHVSVNKPDALADV